MQNNVTYLSRKLQRSLDNNYNVIDMPAVVEIISSLEKTCITKELLETTRLGKYINELRRKTSNESLAKRAKELVKKWRGLVIPETNEQIRSSSANSVAISIDQRSNSPCTAKNYTKKRPASSTPPDNNRSTKKMLLNGQNNREFEFSDNSNFSVKELKKTDIIFINSDSNSSIPEIIQTGDQFEVSNDATDNTDASLGASSMQPKKRGRKKGSKNHKNLVIAAEESFTNKMAVSRNSKVKTTQELLADIQNRKPSTQDIELRAAQLTESLSRIEHKLNPQKQINKNVTPIRTDQQKNSTTSNMSSKVPATSASVHRITSGVVSTEIWSGPSSPEPIVLVASDDEILDVVGTDPPSSSVSTVNRNEIITNQNSPVFSQPLTIENLLNQLPTIDKSCLNEPDEIPLCECETPKVSEMPQANQHLQQDQERITVQIVGTERKETSVFAPPSPVTFFSEKTAADDERTSDNKPSDVIEPDDNKIDLETSENHCEIEENLLCPAKLYLSEKYRLETSIESEKITDLHEKFLPNVNGNFGTNSQIDKLKNEDYVENIVPNYMSERLIKLPNENFQKYSISIDKIDSSDKRQRCDSEKSANASENDRTTNITEVNDEGQTTNDTHTDTDTDTDFREWHETLDVISYNNELLRILPYVIID